MILIGIVQELLGNTTSEVEKRDSRNFQKGEFSYLSSIQDWFLDLRKGVTLHRCVRERRQRSGRLQGEKVVAETLVVDEHGYVHA